MKKIALALAVGLLAACGGSGGGGTTTATAPGATTPYQTATLNVTIKQTPRTAPTPYTISKQMRRLMVTNPNIKDNQGNIVQFTTPDYEIGSPTPPLTVPVANGCIIEALDYNIVGNGFTNYTSVTFTSQVPGIFKSYSAAIPATETLTKPYVLVQYARLEMDIVAGPNTATLVPGAVTTPVTTFPAITGRMTSADVSNYIVSTVIPVTSPFDPANWQLMKGYTAALAAATLSPKITTAASTQTAPLAFDNKTLQTQYYLGAKFFLKESLKRDTDAPDSFYRIYAPVAVILNSNTIDITPTM